MKFEDNLKAVQGRLARAGYGRIRDPYDTSRLAREHAVTDVEAIAKKDDYTVLYLEAKSNWKGIATDVARNNENPCLVITRYDDTRTILSAMRDHGTLNPKPRHIVIESNAAKGWSMDRFMNLIRVRGGDDFLDVDERVHAAMDRFSDYRDALKRFGENLEGIISRTRSMVDAAIEGNAEYEAAAGKLLVVFRKVINDSMTARDIRDMLVQHVLTYRIFSMVYDVEGFHATNAVARELESLRGMLDMPERHVDYSTMEVIAESITGTMERQEFLKRLYETFYEKYDPKRADRDGIVYTPSAVVDFIVKSTDCLLRENFGRSLSDEGVVVLDPFTGTGTFVVHVLERISADRLEAKYRDETRANEISILPYYIAALNIENAYRERTGRYREFENICWMDTFESGTKSHEKLTEYMGYDNVRRIAMQQKSRINVIVGNPPYSARQGSYSEENPNVSYDEIDDRIKNTYAQGSKAANINFLYDSYIRAFRWASDRIAESGIVAFVTNGGFLRSDAGAGIRACLHGEFTDVWCLDLRGNARTKGDMRKREGGNVFSSGSRAPVAITILVRNPNAKGHAIHYKDIGDYLSREEKLKLIAEAGSIRGMPDWKEIIPNRHHDWVGQRGAADDAFERYMPMGSKAAKSGNGNAIFKKYSNGIKTNRDAWLYNFSKKELTKNMKRHIDYCNSQDLNDPRVDPKLGKWTRDLSDRLSSLKTNLKFEERRVRASTYRPFFKQHVYFEEKTFIDQPYLIPSFFPNAASENLVIGIPHRFAGEFSTFIVDTVPDLQILNNGQYFPLYTYDDSGNRQDNVMSWAVGAFQERYGDPRIDRVDIFYYIYGLLHHPAYRGKYQQSLTRGLPHIPLAPDFWAFSRAGKRLADIHLNYESGPCHDLGEPLKPIPNSPRRIAFGKKRNTRKGSRNDYSALLVDDVRIYDNLPPTKYVVNGRTPVQWFVDRYKFSTHKESGITNYPLEGIAGNRVREIVERLAYVGVASDRIISGLPAEFETDVGNPDSLLVQSPQTTLTGESQMRFRR